MQTGRSQGDSGLKQLTFPYRATVLADELGLADVAIEPIEPKIAGSGLPERLWGREGRARELAFAAAVPDGSLPVLLGAGLGVALAALRARGLDVAVVDREEPILSATGVRARFEGDPRVTFLTVPSTLSNLSIPPKGRTDFSVRTSTPGPAPVPTVNGRLDRLHVEGAGPVQEGVEHRRVALDPALEHAVGLVSKWQLGLGLLPLCPVCFPGYPRLDRPFYGELAVRLRKAARLDLGKALAYPRFQSVLPRVLLLRSGYFLEREIAEGLDSLGAAHRSVDAAMADKKGDVRFVERLLTAILEFKPDFVLAVNHLGVDREGALQDLLDRLSLPLASWFVDSPHLILYRYAGLLGGRTAIFTFDSATLPLLRDMGFAQSFYLPLGTSMVRFGEGVGGPDGQESIDVSFVGESMLGPVRKLMDESGLPAELKQVCATVAAQFAGSGDYTVGSFLDRCRPDLRTRLDALGTPEQRLAFERIVTFEATRQYRTACVRQLLPFGPVIHGDRGWGQALGTRGRCAGWKHRAPVEYYRELPRVYGATKVNFNCTSLQMKEAVNQRVFDVPACGRFVLTDGRPQMDGLFEPGKEYAAYGSPEEIPELVRFYLDNTEARHRIAQAARRRVLAEHTYAHRLRTLLRTMRETFG